MPTPIYPSWNDKEFDLLKKMTENTALIAGYNTGSVASVAGTANQLLVNGGTAAATGNITLSLPSTLVAPGSLTVSSGANLTSSSTNSYIYDGTGWVWTSTGTSGGTVKGGIYTAGGQLFITANSSLATNRFSLNSSGDATVAGNLTVSGTGTSNVAGPWKIKPATNTSQLILEQNNATANWNIFCDSTTGGLSFIRNTSGTTYFSIIASSNATIGIDTTISGDLSVNNVKLAAGYSVDWGFGTSIKRVTADGRLQLNSQNGAYEFTGTGAATLAGNLAVNGTGTSSFASGSKLGVGTTSPGVTFVAVGAPATLNYTIGSTSLADIRSTSAAATNAGPSLTFSGYYQTSVNTSTYGAIKGILQGAGDGNSAAGALTFLTANGAGSLSEWARLTNSGNLLLKSDGIDGGNGKLQLATHSTSAGGIGFGSDTALYRSAANTLGLSGGLAIIAGSNTTGFNQDATLSNFSSTNGVYLNGNASGWLRLTGSGGGGASILLFGGTGAGATMYFSTNNSTTALTLDGSQRMLTTGMAAFGGTTFLNATQWTAGSSGFGANGFDKAVIGYLKSSTNGAMIAGHNEYLSAWAPLNIAGSNLTFRTNGELIALTLDSSQNATFAGAVLCGAGFYIGWNGRSNMVSPSDGVITLRNAAGTFFNRLQFGGTTASFPALQYNSTDLKVVLADNSGLTGIEAKYHTSSGAAPTVSAGQFSYGGTTDTTVGAAGGASALPATPLGYVIVNVGGISAKIPYYNA